jgi:hypothetical protein
MRGQSAANHPAITSGSRSRGTRLGFCGVNSQRRSQSARYLGLRPMPNSWRIRWASRGPVQRSVGKPCSVGLSASQRLMIFSWVHVNFGGRPAAGWAGRAEIPACRKATIQRRTERGSTPRKSATSSAEYPSRTRSTAKRRLCSNSAGVPLFLILKNVKDAVPSGHYFSDFLVVGVNCEQIRRLQPGGCNLWLGHGLAATPERKGRVPVIAPTDWIGMIQSVEVSSTKCSCFIHATCIISSRDQ